jgi:hypothetical protein
MIWVRGRDGRHRRVKDRSRSLAKRIDVHPFAVERFETAERVYFGIEGCIKADAILTAILETGEPATVFSVPSVTLWDARELKRFAMKYLAGKIVIIVPDSDWHENPGVYTQAMLCRQYLRHRCRVEAHVEAPGRRRRQEAGRGRLPGCRR